MCMSMPIPSAERRTKVPRGGKQQRARKEKRSTDSEMAGIKRTQVVDTRHIAYRTKDPADVRHLTPRARQQMGFPGF